MVKTCSFSPLLLRDMSSMEWFLLNSRSTNRLYFYNYNRQFYNFRFITNQRLLLCRRISRVSSPLRSVCQNSVKFYYPSAELLFNCRLSWIMKSLKFDTRLPGFPLALLRLVASVCYCWLRTIRPRVPIPDGSQGVLSTLLVYSRQDWLRALQARLSLCIVSQCNLAVVRGDLEAGLPSVLLLAKIGLRQPGFITSILPIILLLLSQTARVGTIHDQQDVLAAYYIKQIPGKMQSDSSQVLSHLNRMGYHFANEKAFIENSRDDKRLLWNIIGQITRPFQPVSLRNIAIAEAYAVGDDLERHRQSLPFMQNLCVMKQLFRKLEIPFSLMTFLRPTAKEIIPMMHKLIRYAVYYQEMGKQHETKIVELQQLQKTNTQKQAQLNALKEELSTIQTTKERDRPIVQQRQQELADLKDNARQTKTQNLHLSTSCAEAERKKRQKQGELRIQQSKIKQKQLDIIDQGKLLAEVCPDIQKQRTRKQQQLEQTRRRNNELERLFHQKTSGIHDRLQEVKEKHQPSRAQLNQLSNLEEEWSSIAIKQGHEQQKLHRQREERKFLETELAQKKMESSELYVRAIETRQKCLEFTQQLNQAKISYDLLEKETTHFEVMNAKLQSQNAKLEAGLKKLEEKTELMYQQKETALNQINEDFRKWNEKVERIINGIGESFKLKYA